MVFKITMRAGGVDPEVGVEAARDIEDEFRLHRPWHQSVSCTFANRTLTLTATNDFDDSGQALSDEFSDCLSACIPIDKLAADGLFEIVSVEHS